MQDFNYLFSNSFEITIEMSCCKYPPVSKLTDQWNLNKNSLVRYLLKGHTGIKGIVTDANNNPVQNAKVEITGRAKEVFTTERGEYWRILVPGTYTVRAVAPNGQHSDSVQVTVGSGQPQRLDLTLNRQNPSLSFQLPPYFSKSEAGLSSAPAVVTQTTESSISVLFCGFMQFLPGC